MMQAEYFDGRSSQAQRVTMGVEGAQLVLFGPSLPVGGLQVPLKAVQWSEQTRHGARVADLGASGQVHALDASAWDAWVEQHVGVGSWVVRLQRSWRGIAASVALLVMGLWAMYVWGLPWLSRQVVPLIPASIDRTLGASVMSQIDQRLFKPSQLPMEQRERIRNRFFKMVGGGPQGMPLVNGHLTLEFRASPRIGPNAFALPGGTVVLTDELVQMVDNEDILMGVLAHEWGHVRHRHGMRQLVQVGILQAGLSVAMGDYASFLTTAPLIVATMGYSREHEREADAESVRLLRSVGVSPEVMVQFFEKAQERKSARGVQTGVPGIAILSSHPDDAERIAYFRQAARGE